MTLMMGMLAKNPTATTFGVRGHYTSSTAGTVHTVSGVDFGGPTGLLVILTSFPSDTAWTSLVANSHTFTGGIRDAVTSNSTCVVSQAAITDTSGTLTATFPSSVTDVTFSVFRLDTTATTRYDSSSNGSLSATSMNTNGLSTVGGSTPSYILSLSTHGNTNPSSVATLSMSPTAVQSGDITVGSRIHTWYYARAGATTVTGQITHSWTGATNCSTISAIYAA